MSTADKHHSIIGCEVCLAEAAIWVYRREGHEPKYMCIYHAVGYDPDPAHWRRLEIRD